MTKNFVYLIPCNCGKEYKVKLKECQKVIIRSKSMKSSIVDHVWKERVVTNYVELSKNTRPRRKLEYQMSK